MPEIVKSSVLHGVTAQAAVPTILGSSVGDRVSRVLVGSATIVSSVVYLFSDVLEVIQGGFSATRLVLTYVGEAALPLVIVGLYAVQRPRIGRLGLCGALAFAYAYIFFATTVMYALVDSVRNYDDVTDTFGWWMTLHGLVMLVGGIAFGVAVIRAGVLPRWTGATLMIGVVLIAAAAGLSTAARTVAEAVTATSFIAMGWSLLGRRA